MSDEKSNVESFDTQLLINIQIQMTCIIKNSGKQELTFKINVLVFMVNNNRNPPMINPHTRAISKCVCISIYLIVPLQRVEQLKPEVKYVLHEGLTQTES